MPKFVSCCEILDKDTRGHYPLCVCTDHVEQSILIGAASVPLFHITATGYRGIKSIKK
jgi:hypothetical protein